MFINIDDDGRDRAFMRWKSDSGRPARPVTVTGGVDSCTTERSVFIGRPNFTPTLRSVSGQTRLFFRVVELSFNIHVSCFLFHEQFYN